MVQAGNFQEALKYAESALASMQEVMGIKVRRMCGWGCTRASHARMHACSMRKLDV